MTSHAERAEPVDLLIVGAGIVGLAHAVDAHARGLRVAVVERDERAVGASVRNFGHVCTTAQSGRALDLALIARESWLRLSEKAGFTVEQAGTLVVARTDAEAQVLREFESARGTDQVRLLGTSDLHRLVPGLAIPGLTGAAHLPLDLRLDPREAIPALSDWLSAEGVDIRWCTQVAGVDQLADGVEVRTSRGPIRARHVVVCLGHNVDRLFPDLVDDIELRRCRLTMLEVAPPGELCLGPALLTGTSMLRYPGLSSLPAAEHVRAEIAAARPELLDHVVNLMLTQRRDGSLVLGDTHELARTHSPFEDETETGLLLAEGERLFGAPLTVRRHWRGVYASAPGREFLTAAPAPDVRVVSVTSGIGMTTALGLAPTVLDDLL